MGDALEVLERRPDALIVVVDASNLDNHLRFAMQLIALGLPVVVALNMIDLAERERLVRDLGSHDAMILRSHGLLTCGATLQQAFNTLYQLEMSCRAQVDALSARTELDLPSAEVLERTAKLYQPGVRRPYGVLEWPAMIRLLEAESKRSPYPYYAQ